MIALILRLLRLEIVYVCEWGEYSHRYDSLDYMAMRPVHRQMSVAPPWAKTVIRRIKPNAAF